MSLVAGYRALPSSPFETLALSSAAELVGVARPRCGGSVTRESDISNGENGDISIGDLHGMHARSGHGNREISRPTTGPRAVWSASGRRGAVADDARTGEVRPRHRSGEAGEQRRATVRGVGGAKGGGRGERGSGPHAPGSGPGKRVKGAGPRTARCTAEKEGTVHRAPPPCHPQPAPDGLLRPQAA